MSLKIVYATIIILLLTNIYFILLNNTNTDTSSVSSEINEEKKITRRKSLVQDFYYYTCKKMERIGGSIYSTNKQERVEGGWFVCLDKLIAPEKNNCNVLFIKIIYNNLNLKNIYGSLNVKTFSTSTRAFRIGV